MLLFPLKRRFREISLLMLVFGVLLYSYSEHVQWARFGLPHMLNLQDLRDDCIGTQVIDACGKEELVKVLFVVDTALSNTSNRWLARSTYAKRSFAQPIHWLTVFNLVGNITDPNGQLKAKARSECQAYGDIVALRKNGTGEFMQPGKEKDSSYIQFVPWILENCPRVDLVVFMQDHVIPHPFYLPNYRFLHMDHSPEVVHCHSLSESPSTSFCRWWSVVMAKKPALEAFGQFATVQEGEINLNGMAGRDIGSYVSVDDSITMLYTIGAVLFYSLPPNLDMNMTSVWTEMLLAPENNPDYLVL